MKTFFSLCIIMSFVLSAVALGIEIGATTQATEPGPDVVILKELEDLYEPVPFDHKSHAQMSEMWDGCTTCHHRSPTTQAAGVVIDPATVEHDQAHSGQIPACKSCHAIAAETANIRMPALKGAYHRQCLNCHREWTGENSCTICHKPKDAALVAGEPTPGDIIGRMHPPTPEPTDKLIRARFSPAMGSNVIFRHKEHTEKYGLKCVNCHRRDTCGSCHTDAQARPASALATGPRPLQPGRTWEASHAPCVSCHLQDRCKTCHYKDDEPPPPPFEHASTGQRLDRDHAGLRCAQCHTMLKARTVVTCGDASCHGNRAMTFPRRRPGRIVTTAPAATAPSTQPIVQTRPGPEGAVIKRVRRAPGGGQ